MGSRVRWPPVRARVRVRVGVRVRVRVRVRVKVRVRVRARARVRVRVRVRPRLYYWGRTTTTLLTMARLAVAGCTWILRGGMREI